MSHRSLIRTLTIVGATRDGPNERKVTYQGTLVGDERGRCHDDGRCR